ncbi:MAG: hypothetical protein IIU70_05910, partial [Anaerotignum sp.]|nr:hypothetical protein [Anaerotignum sp.]
PAAFAISIIFFVLPSPFSPARILTIAISPFYIWIFSGGIPLNFSYYLTGIPQEDISCYYSNSTKNPEILLLFQNFLRFSTFR